MPNAATRPPVNVGFLSSPRSNIGCFCTSWLITNATSSTAAAIRHTATRESDHDSCPARISAYTSAPSATLNVTNPTQSGRPARGSCDSLTRQRPMAMATRQIGMLT